MTKVDVRSGCRFLCVSMMGSDWVPCASEQSFCCLGLSEASDSLLGSHPFSPAFKFAQYVFGPVAAVLQRVPSRQLASVPLVGAAFVPPAGQRWLYWVYIVLSILFVCNERVLHCS